MARKRKKLRMQTLEEKALMAGDVAVSVIDGDLQINEASDSIGQDQQVEVRQLENGKIRVQGLNGTQIKTRGIQWNPWTGSFSFGTIGVDYKDYDVSGGIDVDLGNGRDNFTTNAGGPTLDIEHLNVEMGGDSNRDFVALRNLQVEDDLHISTGGGNDSVSLHTVGVEDGDIDIFTGNGSDHVRFTKVVTNGDARVDMADNLWSAERDTLAISSSTLDDLEVQLGGGNDQVDLMFASLDDVDIDAGAGDDDVVAMFSDVDELNYDGGSGADEYWAYYLGGVDTNDIDLDLSSANFRAYGQV